MKKRMPCPACSSPLEITLPKATEPINTPTLTLAGAAHEKPIHCAGCGQYFIIGATKVTFDWSMVPITAEQAAQLNENRIVTPPAGILSLV